MKVIKIHHPHQLTEKHFPELVIALGFFDGVHRGHQKVIGTAKEIADKTNRGLAVMTFDPHPSVVLAKEKKDIQYITPLQEKIDRIKDLGVEYLFIVRFTSAFASLKPEQFVDQFLIKLHAKHVVAGFDYTYGQFGKGTMEGLVEDSKGMFDVTTVGKLEQNNEKVSSTLIRKQLSEGAVESVNQLLGRPYTISGTVVHGEKRGRTIGFPTANISAQENEIIPQAGVYAVKVKVGRKWENGVCNVGYRPTFHDPNLSELSIEVHILNFSNYIYGEEVVIKWYKRIRAEQKFNGIDELIAQIGKDKQQTEKYFQDLDKEA